MIRKLFKVLRCVLIGCKNPVFESMTCLEHKGVIVRVWREHKTFFMGPDTEVESLLRDCLTRLQAPKEIALTVGSLPRVAAIEILRDRDRNGLIFYQDWR